MEGTQSKLGTRFTDGLSSNDTDNFTLLDEPARGKVASVALGTYALAAFAGKNRTDFDLLDRQRVDKFGILLANLLTGLDDEFSGKRVEDIVDRGAAEYSLAQRLDNLILVLDGGCDESAKGSAVVLGNDDIVGYIKERDKQAAQNLRRKLNRILNPQYEATLTYVFGDFRRVIGCKIDDAPIFKRKPIFEQFTVSLSCLNPFWREETETREDIATWIGGFEFPVPDGLELYDGWEIGYRQPSLIVNVYNSGDVKSGIRIEFRAIGAVTNPVLLNVDTREFIKLNISLVAGDVLTVSTGYGEKAVKLNRGGTITDAFRYLDVDSSYLQIAVGDNLFRYSADANAENLEVSIYHNNLYLGV